MEFTRIVGDVPQNKIRLPRLGKIRLGIKRKAQSGKEYPVETEYFVVPPGVADVVGAEPRQLDVMLPVEDEHKVFRQYYACYGGNQRLKCQGNGEIAERRSEDGKGISQVQCPSPKACDFAQQYKCSARIDLMVVLPAVNLGGVFQLSSGSVTSDIDIRSGIEMARYLFNRISWVPMRLERSETKIPDPESGKMMRHWTVRLYPVATVDEANRARLDSGRIIEMQSRYELPEPVIEGLEPTDDDEASTGNTVADCVTLSTNEFGIMFKGFTDGLSKCDSKPLVLSYCDSDPIRDWLSNLTEEQRSLARIATNKRIKEVSKP